MSDTPETDTAIKDQSKWMRPFVSTTFDGITYDSPVASLCRKLERERDEAREALENHTASTIHSCHDQCQRPMCVLRRERDEAREVASGLAVQEERVEEAQKELSSIHRWIERNHPDGFIDSMTSHQNLERVTDRWYDRLDRLEIDAGRFERERDEWRKKFELSVDAVEIAARLARAESERDEARELAQQMSESNQVLQAEVRDYRKTAAKTPLSNNEMHLNLVLQEVAKLAKILKEERDEALDKLSQLEIVAVKKCQTTPNQK